MVNGSFHDLWEVFVEGNMYVGPEECDVCKNMLRKKTKRHLVATCPECGNLCHSNGKVNGIVRFTCRECKEKKMKYNFTLNTCWEHIHYRIECSHLVLKLLGNGCSLKGIRELTGLSRQFIDLIISLVSEKIADISTIREHIEKDFLAIYIDGTYAVRGCIIIAKIGEEILWLCTSGEDTESIKELLQELKKHLDVKNLVFITDGLKTYVNAIQDEFPEAIHVRHFHNTWEDILVHFQHENKRYTIHMKSNYFIPSGTHEITLWKGTKYFLNNRSGKITKTKKDELEQLLVSIDQIHVQKKWNGRLMQKFSIWLFRVSDNIIDNKLPIETVKTVKSTLDSRNIPLSFREPVKQRIMEFERRILRKERKYAIKGNTSQVRVERLAKGDARDIANKNPFIQPVLELLKIEFDGKHITSNPVEGIHSIVLPILHTHRTTKGSSRLINVVLFLRFSNMHVEEIYTYSDFLNARIIRESMKRLYAGKTYFTRYVDKHGNETERVVDVLDINGRYVEVYCHLEKDFRTFRRERIVHFEEITQSNCKVIDWGLSEPARA